MSCPGVEAAWASLTAAITTLGDFQYQHLLEQLFLPMHTFSLNQLQLLYQLLEKHVLVFAAMKGP